MNFGYVRESKDRYMGMKNFNKFRKESGFLRALDEDLILTSRRFDSRMEKSLEFIFKVLGFDKIEEERECVAIQEEINKRRPHKQYLVKWH